MDVGVRQCPACGGGACGRPRTRSISAHNLRVGPAENSDDRRRIFLIDGSRPLCVAGRAAARLTDRRARWSFSSSIFSLCFFFSFCCFRLGSSVTSCGAAAAAIAKAGHRRSSYGRNAHHRLSPVLVFIFFRPHD